MVTKNIQVDIQVAYINQWLKIEAPIELQDIASVEIKFNTDAVATVSIDRIETLARSYITSKVTLEKLTSELTKDYSLSTAEFGDRFETLEDTIAEKVQAGDLALAVQTKQ
jgi:hypothetical protein